MLLSHLLSHDREHHRATLMQEAEHARLIQLARSETSHLLPRWFALPRQASIHLFWSQAVQHGRTAALTAQRNTSPVLSAACCCPCSC